jgi:phosphosulfolactate phosphohydrolase-like enzyme
MERSRNRSSNAESEKMERVGEREGKMERYFSTGQSPQRAVAPTEEEEEEEECRGFWKFLCRIGYWDY